MLLLRVAVFAEEHHEHQHGVNGIPDWYDPACCNRRDCRPVEDSNDIEPFLDGGAPAIRYKPTGNVFVKAQFRKSQDERFHVCISATGYSYCVYIPAMG